MGFLNDIGNMLGGAVNTAGSALRGIFAPSAASESSGQAGVVGTNEWLGNLRDIINQGLGIYSDIRGATDSSTQSQQTYTQPTTQPTYNPNITLGDFVITPNWYLIGFGVLLLIIAYFMSRK